MRSLYRSPFGPGTPKTLGGGKSLMVLIPMSGGPNENLVPKAWVIGLVEAKGYSVDYSLDLLLLMVELTMAACLIDADSGMNELSWWSGDLFLNGDILFLDGLSYGDILLSTPRSFLLPILLRSTLLFVTVNGTSVTLGPRCFSADFPIDLCLRTGYWMISGLISNGYAGTGSLLDILDG